MRRGVVERNTLETKIKVDINLDGSGKVEIDTGIGFRSYVDFNGISRKIWFDYFS